MSDDTTSNPSGERSMAEIMGRVTGSIGCTYIEERRLPDGTIEIISEETWSRDMPNKPRTPVRGIRIHDDVWNAAQERAKAEGTTMTAIITKAVEKYARVKTPEEPRAKWGSRVEEEADADA